MMSLSDEIRLNCAAWKHVDDETLDELVHDAKAAEASDINNAGRDEQIGYLVGEGIRPPPAPDPELRRFLGLPRMSDAELGKALEEADNG